MGKTKYYNLISYNRRRNELSQEDVAMISGIELSVFEEIESGKLYPTYEQLELIANALDVPVQAILGNFEYNHKEKQARNNKVLEYMKEHFLRSVVIPLIVLLSLITVGVYHVNDYNSYPDIYGEDEVEITRFWDFGGEYLKVNYTYKNIYKEEPDKDIELELSFKIYLKDVSPTEQSAIDEDSVKMKLNRDDINLNIQWLGTEITIFEPDEILLRVSLIFEKDGVVHQTSYRTDISEMLYTNKLFDKVGMEHRNLLRIY